MRRFLTSAKHFGTDEDAEPGASANGGAAHCHGTSLTLGKMPVSPSLEQKLAFADACIRLLENRALDVAQPFREVIMTVRKRPTLRKVDSVYHDLLEWCRCLPTHDRREISEELQRTVGMPLEYFDTKRLERIAKITRRGLIRSDDEWRFIEERVQELSENSDLDEEVERLNRLLAAYEKRKTLA